MQKSPKRVHLMGSPFVTSGGSKQHTQEVSHWRQSAAKLDIRRTPRQADWLAGGPKSAPQEAHSFGGNCHEDKQLTREGIRAPDSAPSRLK